MEPDDKTITITPMDGTTDTITIDLSDTYGTTTTYWAGDSISDITISGINNAISGTGNGGTFTYGSTTINVDWLDTRIDPDEIERMCKEYPALEKTWRNFKATYDLVKQDWKGKQDGEDELPF
jgi:hypothetical protein